MPPETEPTNSADSSQLWKLSLGFGPSGSKFQPHHLPAIWLQANESLLKTSVSSFINGENDTYLTR